MSPLTRALALLPLAGLLASATHCATGQLARPLLQAPEYAPVDQTKCGIVKSPQKPLVVEWPAMDRVTLEAKAKEGVVAVRYVGCNMEVLSNCRAPVRYTYTATTLERDTVHLRNADELYSTLPLGAARLEATMERSGELQVDMTIVGRYASASSTLSQANMVGPDCGRATHVITGLEVGAFDFKAVADGQVGGGAHVLGAALGAKSTAHQDQLAQDGSDEACTHGTEHDGAPPVGCGAVLRVEVTPLSASRTDCPAGTQLQEERCIPLVSLACPGGMHFEADGGGCVPNLAPCPEGTTPRDNQCVRLVAVAEAAPVMAAPIVRPVARGRLCADGGEPLSDGTCPPHAAPLPKPARPDDTIAAGEDLYLSGDYPAALAYFRSACQRGSAFSCSAAGDMTAKGTGVPQNKAAARLLFGQGCRNGDVWGCTLLRALDASE